PVLHEQLTDPSTRRTAIRGLAAIPHDATAKRVLAVYPRLTADERQDAVATLAARKESALALLDAVDKRAVPRADVSAFAARQMYALGDPKLTDRLRQVWGEVRDTSPNKAQQMTRYKALLTPAYLRRADLSNGR